MRRPEDWFRQAERDLAAAEHSASGEHHEWACFLAQQAGEKALKAVHEAAGTEAWGHSLTTLLRELRVSDDPLVEAAKGLDKHYIPTRYPDVHPGGAPSDLYTARDSSQALGDARTLLSYARDHLPPAGP